MTLDLTQRIVNLSVEKRALLERELLKRAAATASRPAIPRRGTGSHWPLSYAQLRLWILDQMEPGRGTYNIVVAVRLKGNLLVEGLQWALGELLRRHEALRTRYVIEKGEPAQVVWEWEPAEIKQLDLRGMGSEDQQRESQRLLEEEAERGFDLSRDAMLRAMLVREGEQEWALSLVTHHIASDGWSQGALIRELGEFYRAYCEGREARLEPLPIQYADYAVWQRQRLTGELLEEQLGYWKRQLGGEPLALDLPTDRPRPARQSFRGGRERLKLPKGLSEELKQLSRREGVTLFMTLLAAFQVLLSRYTGKTDVVVGTATAGRNRAELEGLIGFFVNTLALRTSLSGDPSFRELLGRSREVALGAYGHQDAPFEKLVEELHPERELGRNPLFQVMFVLQNVHGRELGRELELTGVDVSRLEVDNGTAKFDLTLSLSDSEDGFIGMWEYSADLFDRETIRRMAGHFQRLLEGIVADPEARISQLPLLKEAERRQLLEQWSGSAVDYPGQQSVVELFEEQVRSRPEAVAVVSGKERLTYGELNRRANQLARHLRELGAGPERLVGLCVERSAMMVVGVLGILKAGSAYLPLDPGYPTERLAQMLKDAGVELVLTHGKTAQHLPVEGLRLVRLDADWEKVAAQSRENLAIQIHPDNLAYVIYTSGSTGIPKGVAVPHRGVVRLLFGVDYARLGPGERFLHLSSISFDASTFEVWGALLHGAQCVIFPDRVPIPRSLERELKVHKITILWLTSALFNLVIDEKPEILSGVRQLLVGGEALSVPHVLRAFKALPTTQIVNGYGPTENTTFTCCYLIPRNLDPNATSVPIGRPIANTWVYVLDAYRNPVPVGVPGELYAGGAGLAQGYLNQPKLTTEKFVSNPFSKNPESCLYRTGDLVRFLPDGNLEFLGRLDDQVKIRGFRVELGELESAIVGHPTVRQAVAVVRTSPTGERYLAAYATLREGASLRPEELVGYLKSRLPDYLLPSSVSLLKDLPLNANGKVDRGRLPAPEDGLPRSGEGYVAPNTEEEETLARIWARLLGVKEVGVRDNFFELGGHSLLAVRLCAQIEMKFGMQVPLATLYNAPTVEQLAKALRQEGRVLRWSRLAPIRSGGARPPFFMHHGTEILAQGSGVDQPFYLLEPHGIDGRRAPRTVEEMAADYRQEIRTIQPEGPYYLGGYSLGGLVAYETAQQLKRQGQDVGLLLLLDPTLPRQWAGTMVSESTPRVPARSGRSGNLQNPIRVGWNQLLSGPLLGRQRWLITGLKWRLAAIKGRIRKAAEETVCSICLGLGRRVPPSLRRLYFLRAGMKAARRYEAQPYPGQIVLLQAENGIGKVDHIWKGLATEGLVLHELPGTHLGIIQGAESPLWADQLAACLDEAQSEKISRPEIQYAGT